VESDQVFYVDNGGNLQGPYNREEILSFATNGQIEYQTRIEENGQTVTALQYLGQSEWSMIGETRDIQTPKRVKPEGYTTAKRNANARLFGGLFFAAGIILAIFVDLIWAIIPFGFGALVWVLGQKTED